MAYAVAAHIARQEHRTFDVYLLSEPGDHLDRIPADCPIGILLKEFRTAVPDRVARDPFHAACALRLFIPEVLSPFYPRVLYIDADVRVEEGLDDLFRLDLGGAPIAAVDDYTLPFLPKDKKKKNENIRRRRQAIGHSAADPFFNSGVMLIDTERWHAENMTHEALRLMDELGSFAPNDQEVLNVLLRRRWAALTPRWNFTFFHDLGFEPILRPVITHYAGSKPWELRWDRSPSHLAALDRHFANTPFAHYRHPAPSLRERWARSLRAAKWSLRQKRLIRPHDVDRQLRCTSADQMRSVYASYLIDNIRSGRFLDVQSGVSILTEQAVMEVARMPSNEER